MAISYLTTIPGMIKGVEEVFNFIGFICLACNSALSTEAEAFLAATILAFILTAVLLIIYVMDLQEKIPGPLIKIQFFYCLFFALFILITSALVIDVGAGVNDSYVAGGVFGLFSTVTYLIDAFFKYQKSM